MSWKLLLFASADPLLEDAPLLSMGSPAQVRQILDKELPGLVWQRDGWGHYGDETCQLEFSSIKSDDPVVLVDVNVRGLGAVKTMLRMARNHGWHLVDGSSMKKITTDE